jgi:hypothetical protein
MKKPKEKQIEVVATNTERRLPWGLVESEPVYKKPDHPRTEADYHATLLESVSQEDWGEVIKNTVKKAKHGDAVALNWLAQYLMGKPDVRVPTPIVSIIEPAQKLTS